MQADGVIYNAALATFDPRVEQPFGLLPKGVVAWKNGKFVAVGADIDPGTIVTEQRIDARAQLITPGLIDCHTHLVYAGDRAQEFEWRLQGKSYQAIAREGGGIMSTVAATRKCAEQDLFDLALQRVNRLLNTGVTTVEIKSGYGLDVENEIKMLKVIQRLKNQTALEVRATCLAAHTLPADFSGSKDEYIDRICQTLLPEIKRLQLAEAVDVFCESIAFDAKQTKRLFSCAKALGFQIKGHVEQLSQSHGSEVVCEFSGVSADHLEYVDENQVSKMQQAGVTAVLLPGAFYYLGEKRKPPVELFRQSQVPMAIATDVNPGSSPVFSILSAANMACVMFGLTPQEALTGITVFAAKALGLQASKGMLRNGMDADFILWPAASPNMLVYEQPAVAPMGIWIAGQPCKRISGAFDATRP